MSNAARNSKDSDTEQRNRFIELSTRLAELAKAEGLEITPFKDPHLPHFFASSFERREQALRLLELTVKLSEDTQRRGENFARSAPLIWSFCQANKYSPTSDFYDKIEEGDMVDVYNEQGQLIFANLLFYSVVPYSLEELYFKAWHDLFFHMPADFQARLREICQTILKSPQGLYDLRDLGEHTVVATGETPFRIVARPTYFSSLVHSGKVAGYVCINKIVNITS